MSVTVVTIFPLSFLKVVEFNAVVAGVVVCMAFLMIIPLFTFIAVVVPAQKRRYFCNDIKVIVMMVQVYFLVSQWTFVYYGIEIFF